MEDFLRQYGGKICEHTHGKAKFELRGNRTTGRLVCRLVPLTMASPYRMPLDHFSQDLITTEWVLDCIAARKLIR